MAIKQHYLYNTWEAMRARCNNINHKSYKDYGGRGIKVCSRWDDFLLFIADMGERPDGLEIDRINNDGNYEPSNCRWVDHRSNALNRRVWGTSKYRGVYFCKGSGKWRAQIRFKCKKYMIGRFSTEEEAHAAYLVKFADLSKEPGDE